MERRGIENEILYHLPSDRNQIVCASGVWQGIFDSVADCSDSSDGCANCTSSSLYVSSQTDLIGSNLLAGFLVLEVIGIVVLNLYALRFHIKKYLYHHARDSPAINFPYHKYAE